MVKLPDLKRCERCGKLYEDLFNGLVCAVCYIKFNTEIMELDKAQDIRIRRQIAERHKEKK